QENPNNPSGNVHFPPASELCPPDLLTVAPATPVPAYRDRFGNWCSRIVAPPGRVRLRSNGIVRDSGRPDAVPTFARQVALQDLPEETLLFLLGSRYCETDLLSDLAWSLFGHTTAGGARVQAICDFVHNHISFNYQNARSTRTAWEAYNE